MRVTVTTMTRTSTRLDPLDFQVHDGGVTAFVAVCRYTQEANTLTEDARPLPFRPSDEWATAWRPKKRRLQGHDHLSTTPDAPGPRRSYLTSPETYEYEPPPPMDWSLFFIAPTSTSTSTSTRPMQGTNDEAGRSRRQRQLSQRLQQLRILLKRLHGGSQRIGFYDSFRAMDIGMDMDTPSKVTEKETTINASTTSTTNDNANDNANTNTNVTTNASTETPTNTEAETGALAGNGTGTSSTETETTTTTTTATTGTISTKTEPVVSPWVLPNRHSNGWAFTTIHEYDPSRAFYNTNCTAEQNRRLYRKVRTHPFFSSLGTTTRTWTPLETNPPHSHGTQTRTRTHREGSALAG